MGCQTSTEAQADKKIEKELKEMHAKEDETIKLLILGSGDSGKTTLRKQIQNVHTSQFEQVAYRENFGTSIIVNLLDGSIDVLESMGKKEIATELRTEVKKVQRLLPPELAEKLKKEVEADEFQAALKENGEELQLQACYPIYLEKFKSYPTWGGEGWVPDVEDCIRARVRTSGVVTEDVMIEGVKFNITDVGGQKAERRKWLHSFDNMTAAIYVASIADYDITLFEDRTKNRLEDSLELFAEAVNSPWLSKTTIILFLNKRDLFEKKFLEQGIPLNKSGLFPSAPTDQADVQGALDWVSKQFKSKRHGKKTADLYVHITTATDPNNVKAVFTATKNTIIKANMLAAGF